MKLKEIAKLLKNWPGKLALFASGVGLGLLLSLPLFPWRLPGEVLSLFGAVLGAAIGAALAVLGAAQLRRDERREDDEQIQYALDCIIGSIISRFDELFAAAEGAVEDEETFKTEILNVNDYIESQVVVMDRIQSHLAKLGPLHMQVVIDAELTIKRIAELMVQAAGQGGVHYLANPGLEEDLRRHLRNLEGVLEWSSAFEPGAR